MKNNRKKTDNRDKSRRSQLLGFSGADFKINMLIMFKEIKDIKMQQKTKKKMSSYICKTDGNSRARK
jgi:hypothetical protein